MLEIGSVVDGKYKILNKIGQGGMSVVYLAMNERANKQWAIKEVRRDGISNYEVVEQGLIAETDMLKKLNHPHLPSIIDVIQDKDSFLIVMDYIEGRPLSYLLKHQGAQPQENVIEWAKQLCDVLGYLHSREKPIIYRDMKPSNVMLKPDGNVTLIDFGTAREFKEKNVADTTCLGTQGYAAPEQFGGMGQTDARTDIYCLGATLYHLVTGHNPATPPYEMYPITKWNPKLSTGLEKIILKCTQKNPEDRYQSCAELMYALEHYQDLDNEKKKEYTKKWRLFMGSASICLLATAGAVGLKIAENNKIQSTYDYLVEDGDKSSAGKNYEDAIKSYMDAIDIAPEKGKAYINLVEKAILGDDTFSVEENSIITDLKSNADGSGNTYFDILKKNDPAAYGKMMYDLGNAYYYYYDTDSELGRAKAGEYYSRAVDVAKGMDEGQYTRAKTLANICDYIDNVGKASKDGTSKVSYTTLWTDLKATVETEFGTDYSLAIKAYYTFDILLSQQYEQKFIDDKISYQEICDELKLVQEKIADIREEYDENPDMLNEISADELNDVEKNVGVHITEIQKLINRGVSSEEKEDR